MIHRTDQCRIFIAWRGVANTQRPFAKTCRRGGGSNLAPPSRSFEVNGLDTGFQIGGGSPGFLNARGQLLRWEAAQDFPGDLDIPMKLGPVQRRRDVLPEGVRGRSSRQHQVDLRDVVVASGMSGQATVGVGQ